MKLRNKKTGVILEDVKYIDTSLTTIEIHYLDNGVLRMETEKDYHSFLQNWEDYAPQEPLIKNEKIRNTVRAWAEINNIIEPLTFDSTSQGAWWLSEDYKVEIQFKYGKPDNLLDGSSYTVTELCGDKKYE